LPSAGWRTGQSGADCFPIMAQLTVEDLEPLAHQTLSGAHRTVRCPHQTVGSATRHTRIARPTVGAVDRWLTGQSGAPPDSPVNFSRTPLITSRERRLRRGWLTGQSGAPQDSPVIYSLHRRRVPRADCSPRLVVAHRTLSGAPPDSPVHPNRNCLWLNTANSFPNCFLLFLALRHNTLVFKTMY
jgi:hypothetical protein